MTFSFFNEDRYGSIGDIYFKYYFTDDRLPLVITFAPDGGLKESRAVNGADPWGFKFIKSKGYNVLSFSCIAEKSNYYRDKIFIDTLKNIVPELPNFSERLGYGSSMGGYAVSAYSNILEIERLLLINPITSRRKDIATWDYEAGRSLHTFDYDWSGLYTDGADTKSLGFVIYDPLYKLDKFHAVRYKKLKPLKTYGMGHGLPIHLSSMKILDWIVCSFIENNLDEKEFYNRVRARRFIKRYYDWLLSPQNSRLTPLRASIIDRHKFDIMRKVAHKEGDWEKYTDFFRAPKLPEIDKIRDMAVMLEGIDIKLSYDLMSLALKHKPSNHFLQKKLKDYEKVLFDINEPPA